MFISQIEPIGEATTDLLVEDGEDIIDKIIELPLRRVCKVFREKGIETLMSSANKNNVLKNGCVPTEKEDVYGTVGQMMESHSFLEAGNGYAWVMLNYNSLSDENKRMLFELEKTKDKDGNPVGEQMVWFAHPFGMNGNIEYGLRTGKLSAEYVKQVLGDENFVDGIKFDSSLEEFDNKCIVLFYPWEETTEAVFLRMPVYEKTTVDDVKNYFLTIAEFFKSQKIDDKTDNKTK